MLTYEAQSNSLYWLKYKTVEGGSAGNLYVGDVIERYFVANESLQVVATNASGVEGTVLLTNDTVTY